VNTAMGIRVLMKLLDQLNDSYTLTSTLLRGVNVYMPKRQTVRASV
jgi:hypothetical protein